MRWVFGQNAAGFQIIGLATMVLAVAVLVFVSAPFVRAFAWLGLPIGIVMYVIMGHAPIHGWFLWWHALKRDNESDQ